MQTADVAKKEVPWAIQSLQMRMDIDKTYAESMHHAIQRFLPMTIDESIDRNYRGVIQDRIDTWKQLASDAEKHYQSLSILLEKELTGQKKN